MAKVKEKTEEKTEEKNSIKVKANIAYKGATIEKGKGFDLNKMDKEERKKFLEYLKSNDLIEK